MEDSALWRLPWSEELLILLRCTGSHPVRLKEGFFVPAGICSKVFLILESVTMSMFAGFCAYDPYIVYDTVFPPVIFDNVKVKDDLNVFVLCSFQCIMLCVTASLLVLMLKEEQIAKVFNELQYLWQWLVRVLSLASELYDGKTSEESEAIIFQRRVPRREAIGAFNDFRFVRGHGVGGFPRNGPRRLDYRCGLSQFLLLFD